MAGASGLRRRLPKHSLQVSERLGDPKGARAETERFIAGFIRPHGVERPATPIFADAVEGLAGSRPPAPRAMPAWAPAAWPVILSASIVAAVVDWARRRPFKPMRRALEKAAHRARKTIVRVGSDRSRADKTAHQDRLQAMAKVGRQAASGAALVLSGCMAALSLRRAVPTPSSRKGVCFGPSAVALASRIRPRNPFGRCRRHARVQPSGG